MQLPKISVAAMFGVVMLQLASISAVDGCAHPGGCVSCGFGGSGKSYRLKGDDNAVSTVNDYVISQLGDGDYITNAGDSGLLADTCDRVVKTLRDVMGWGDDTILGCDEQQDSAGFLVTGACSEFSKLHDLVNTAYCLNKPNGCVSCPVGELAIPQADDRALAALTDIVLQAGTKTTFTAFVKGARGGPGILAQGGSDQCEEALPILIDTIAWSGGKDLSCGTNSSPSPGFILGCINLDAIAALQQVIDAHVMSTITAAPTITTTSSATLQPICNKEKTSAGAVSCTGGPHKKCVTVDAEALNTLNCMLDDEGIALLTVDPGPNNMKGCITPSNDAHCQAVSAFFYTHMADGAQACNGDCTLRCVGTMHLTSENCGNLNTGNTGKQYLQDMVVAHHDNEPILPTTFGTDFSALWFDDPYILDDDCEADDTSPATIAMTAFFLGQGLDIYVRCDVSGNSELYMSGKDTSDAAEAMDEFHKLIQGTVARLKAKCTTLHSTLIARPDMWKQPTD